MRATVLLLLGNASWEACTIEFSDLGKGSGVNPKDLSGQFRIVQYETVSGAVHDILSSVAALWQHVI